MPAERSAAQDRYAKGWTRCDVCGKPAVGGNLLGGWCEEHEPTEGDPTTSAARRLHGCE